MPPGEEGHGFGSIRLFDMGVTVTCWEVSISAPSGHLSRVHLVRVPIIYEDVETVTTGRLPVRDIFNT